jgi:hypothetical protein
MLNLFIRQLKCSLLTHDLFARKLSYATQAESGCPESIKDIATHNQLLTIAQCR